MKTKLPNYSLFKFNKNKKKSTNYSLLKQKEIFNPKDKKHFSLEERENIVIIGQSTNLTLIEFCQKERITIHQFNLWSNEFLSRKKEDLLIDEITTTELPSDDKHRIVLEGHNGEYSVAEICRKENITQDKFLKWSDEFLQIRNKRFARELTNDHHTSKIKKEIEKVSGIEAFMYFESFIDVTSKNTYVFDNPEKCSKSEKLHDVKNLVCLSKINDIRYINKHLELINSKLPMEGVFIGCLETLTARRFKKKINKFPLFDEFYFGAEFFFQRIVPKLSFTKKHYFDFTKGNDRLLSKAEGLGRLVSCGFKIMDYKSINGLIYFIVKKIDTPKFD